MVLGGFRSFLVLVLTIFSGEAGCLHFILSLQFTPGLQSAFYTDRYKK